MSAACSALSALDTISYSNTFPAASFSPGETLTVSYTDDGQDPASLPPFASDRVLVQDAGTTNLYGYNYYSSSKINGLRALTITASQLTASGLNLNIQTGTHIGPVAIRCTGSVTAPTVANTASTVAANSSNNAVTLSIGGTATSVAVVSGPGHGAATPSGTSISYTPAPGYYVDRQLYLQRVEWGWNVWNRDRDHFSDGSRRDPCSGARTIDAGHRRCLLQSDFHHDRRHSTIQLFRDRTACGAESEPRDRPVVRYPDRRGTQYVHNPGNG
ncbi:hypothetical protein GCM10009080_47730 [Cupriavidus pauculus]